MDSSSSPLKEVLPNGLVLLGEYSPDAQSCALGFFVKTGARDERSEESGVSHFLEHMMFKGTATLSSLDLTYAMGNIGAQANAFTSEESTVYYASVLPEYAARMQEILSQMLQPALALDEFTTEKKVILEEIALYLDRPHYYLYERAQADFFAGQALGNSVLGSNESIQALTNQQMRAYFQRRYLPSNMVFVVAGNFEWSRVVADAKRLCSDWVGQAETRILSACPETRASKEYRKKGLQQAHTLFFGRGASSQDHERYALAVLGTILGDSGGSRMYWELVDSGLAESAGCDNDEKDGLGVFVASASCEPRNIEKVSACLRTILDTPLEYTDADLQRAKNKLMSRIVLSGELPIGRMMAIGGEWHAERKITSLERVIELVHAVDRAEIEKAMRLYQIGAWSEYRLLPE